MARKRPCGIWDAYDPGVKRGLAVAFAVTLSILGGASAGAKPRYQVSRPNQMAEVRFSGTNGYRFFAIALGPPEGGRASVVISALHQGGYAADYESRHGRLGRDGSIELHLHGVGYIRLEFEPKERRPVQRPEGCRGRKPIELVGLFRGTIELHGRRGFSEASASVARGSLLREFRQVCPKGDRALAHRGRRTGAGVPRFDTKTLDAQERANGAKLRFSVLDIGSEITGTGPAFSASETIRSDGFDFVGRAEVVPKDEPETFAIPDLKAAADATAAPPDPFTGSAAFHLESPTESTWTGDLAVDLPGIGPVALAGPGFASALCVDQRCSGSLPISKTGIVVIPSN